MKTFLKTLLQEKKLLAIVIAVGLSVILFTVIYYKMVRAWNWNVGGYGSRAENMICEMAEKGAIQRGPNWERYCK